MRHGLALLAGSERLVTAARRAGNMHRSERTGAKLITIRHAHADGTLVEGTSRGDGTAPLLKAARFRWFPSLGMWGIPQSRDRVARTWQIDQARRALEAAGFAVTVEIDESARRDFATAEAERYERAEDRAERMSGYAASAAARSEAARDRAQVLADAIPFGQPILVGHHSERRHRRDLDRMHALDRKWISEGQKAEHFARRAETAQGTQAARESLPVTLRRIGKLEAEQRQLRRRVNGTDPYMSFGRPAAGERLERLGARLADIAEELAHWREHVARQESSGVKVWTRADFTRGDYAQFLGRWYEVVRVNAKSVTIPAMLSDGLVVTRANSRLGWTDTVQYHKVTGRKSAAEMAAILAQAERRAAAG